MFVILDCSCWMRLEGILLEKSCTRDILPNLLVNLPNWTLNDSCKEAIPSQARKIWLYTAFINNDLPHTKSVEYSKLDIFPLREKLQEKIYVETDGSNQPAHQAHKKPLSVCHKVSWLKYFIQNFEQQGYKCQNDGEKKILLLCM